MCLCVSKFPYFLNSKQNCDCPSIESVDTYKYLGIIIDKAISWKPHVDYLLGKLRFCLLIVSRLNKIVV